MAPNAGPPSPALIHSTSHFVFRDINLNVGCAKLISKVKPSKLKHAFIAFFEKPKTFYFSIIPQIKTCFSKLFAWEVVLGEKEKKRVTGKKCTEKRCEKRSSMQITHSYKVWQPLIFFFSYFTLFFTALFDCVCGVTHFYPFSRAIQHFFGYSLKGNTKGEKELREWAREWEGTKKEVKPWFCSEVRN